METMKGTQMPSPDYKKKSENKRKENVKLERADVDSEGLQILWSEKESDGWRRCCLRWEATYGCLRRAVNRRRNLGRKESTIVDSIVNLIPIRTPPITQIGLQPMSPSDLSPTGLIGPSPC
ncbi:hypothetical protein L2E82_13337 [Cichorium intybus]|uniref:Uncharacterized protein n=1 Tax=Cichorium intybus TaxID=13427 RepID=A0ACB9EWL0_CICIN|nr:hypothetical protein L2E82_13337 [Cichorium intybus]